jgi:hypothetical protein
MSDSTGKMARTIDLLSAFASGQHELLESSDLRALRLWEDLTARLEAAPYDIGLSQAYDSVYFGGLNASISDKYLSDDPIDSWDITLAAESGGLTRFASNWAPQLGYSFFDYADFDGLQFGDEFVESRELRRAVHSRSRRSLFQQRRQLVAGQHAELDQDVAYRHSYPKAMGRAGSTLLTPSQRRTAAMTMNTKEISRAAGDLARRDSHYGGKIQGALGQPIERLPLIDASLPEAGAAQEPQSPSRATGALASAMTVANSAFGHSTAGGPMAGVFSLTQATDNLILTSVGPQMATGYQRLLFDAADTQWLSLEERPSAVIDAAASTTGVQAPMFTTAFAKAGLTSTRPELFATRLLTALDASMEQLPTTIAGESRYSDLSGIDPVVYLNLEQTTSTPLKRSSGRIVQNAEQMSPQVRASLNAVTMPLSSAGQLQRQMTGAPLHGFDAANTLSVAGGPLSEGIVPPARAAAMIASGLIPEMPMRRSASPAITLRSGESMSSQWLTTDASIEGTPAFYDFAFDAETVLLHPELDWGIGGSHLEMRGGKLHRSIPATSTAQRVGRVQADKTTLVKSTPDAGAERITSDATTQETQLLLSRIRTQEFGMLPPAIQRILGRQAETLVGMTTAGMQQSGLLVRLANVIDTESPGSRSAVIHKLAMLGVDTPELLRVLDESGATDRTTAGIRDLTKQLTGRGSAAIELSDSGKDTYWGDFGPARVAHQSATQLLRALSGHDHEPRTSPAGWDAESSELLSVVGEFERSVESAGPAEMPLAAPPGGSLAAVQIEQMLSSMPGSRNIAAFVGGGFDFTYMVFDRVNGARAGLDAGVMDAMRQATDSDQGLGLERDLRPGLDDWPVEAFEFLSSGERSESGAEDRVIRLERRMDAAQNAFTRLRNARDAGTAPQHFDSVDWSLVSTGISHDAAPSVDIGRLGTTMVRQQSVATPEMSYVAPTVKAVAQQAQLSARDEAVPSSSEGGAAEADSSVDTTAKKETINYNDLASQIASRLQRRFARDRDRHGRP